MSDISLSRRRWPRLVGWTLVMVFALTSTAALGVWQYSVAHRDDVARAVLAADPVEVSSIHRLGEYVQEQFYGHLVRAQGRLDCARNLRVTLGGTKSPWVVCPLMLEDGSALAVVLGEASDEGGLLASAEAVSVTGRLQPAQDTSQLSPLYKPAPAVSYLNTDDLVLRWRSDVLDGYVVATRISTSSGSVNFQGVTKLPQSALVLPPAGIELRNLLYAWQWWFFAAFIIFLWVRFVRDELKEPSGEPSARE